jgi:hypothetical protein
MEDRSPALLASVVSPRLVNSFPLRNLAMTNEDIAMGIRGSAVDCPLAIVLRRVPWIVAVDLSGPQPRFTDRNGNGHNLDLPQEIIDWIGRFDRGEKVEPMNVVLHGDL